MKTIQTLFLVVLFLPSIAFSDDWFEQGFGIRAGIEPDLVSGVGLDSAALLREMNKPEKFPAYVLNTQYGASIRSYRLSNGDLPSGPIRSSFFEIRSNQDEMPLIWESGNTAASNVYWHVFQAISFFEQLGERLGQSIRPTKTPVVIRLDVDVMYAMFITFSNLPKHNTSRVTPEGEVWFHSPKREYRDEWYTFASRTLPGIRDTKYGTKIFPMDTAREPSTIYHEWTHLMTAPYLGIQRTTVLNEGFSDYYSAVIVGRSVVGDTKEFSADPYARNYDKTLWVATAGDDKTPGDFVPTLFWSLRKKFGPAQADALIWRSLKYLNKKSGLADLKNALYWGSQDVLNAADREELWRRLFHYLG